jgi:hypothetical protein
MQSDFPWQVWAVGWLAIFKAILWLAYEPILPEPVLRLLGYKYSLGLVPLIVFGIGVWNLKKWAVWGVIAVAVADLVFFIFNLQTLNAFTIESEVFVFSTILSGIALLCNGPVGDILILLAAPSLIKALKESA